MKVLAWILLFLVTAPVASANHIPKDKTRPCQMVQVMRKGKWSPAIKEKKLRKRIDHDSNRNIRLVPLRSTDIYRTKHSRFLTTCLTNNKFSVDTGKALSVEDCESGFYPKAENGRYKGLFQIEEDMFYSRMRMIRLGSADSTPGTPHAFNGYANTYVALHIVQSEGWGRWSCA